MIHTPSFLAPRSFGRRVFASEATFADDFARADGAPGNGWTGGAIASGVLVITPTLGSEMHTSANAASDPNGNEANATTGLSGSSASLASDSGSPAVGTYAIKVTASGSFGYGQLTWTSVIGAWYRATLKAIRGAQGTTQRMTAWVSLLIPGTTITIPAGASYTDVVVTNRAITTTSAILRFYASNSGASGDILFFDNLSLRPITLSSCLVTRSFSYPLATFGAKFTRPNANVEFGVALYVDANNYVLAYNNGSGTVILDKVVGGTLTPVTSAAGAYSAGALLTLHHEAGDLFDVAYNGSTVIANASITDAVFASATTFALFATDSTITIDDATYVAD